MFVTGVRADRPRSVHDAHAYLTAACCYGKYDMFRRDDLAIGSGELPTNSDRERELSCTDNTFFFRLKVGMNVFGSSLVC